MARNVNFRDFGAQIRTAVAKFQADVKEAVEINIGDMELQAIRDAPGGGDLIRTQHGPENQQDIARGRNWVPISQAIGYKLSNRGLTGTVYVERSAGELAAYVEFGTGQSAATYLASVPPEWRAVAQRYYVNGRGTIINQPYLLPAFMKYKEQFVKDLKSAIKNSFKTV